MDPYIWTTIFGPVYLDLSVWIHLFGHVCLDPSFLTHIFENIVLVHLVAVYSAAVGTLFPQKDPSTIHDNLALALGHRS